MPTTFQVWPNGLQSFEGERRAEHGERFEVEGRGLRRNREPDMAEPNRGGAMQFHGQQFRKTVVR